MNDCPMCEEDYGVVEKKVLAVDPNKHLIISDEYGSKVRQVLWKIEQMNRMRQELKLPDTYRRAGRKIGRNEECPCGSGLKYKKCCGK